MGGIDSWKAPAPQTEKIEQGDAGFLTQAELDEMAGDSTEAKKPVEAENGLVELAENPAATPVTAEVVTLSPEKRDEVLEMIEQEEARLNANATRNQGLLKALDVKLNDPVAQQAETPSRKLLTFAKITETYRTAEQKINKLGQLGNLAVLGLMTSGMAVGEYGLNQSELSSSHDAFMHAGTTMMEAGVVMGGVVAAGWAISKTMNWLSRRSKEKKMGNGESVYA